MITNEATSILGLTDNQEHELFYPTNLIGDLHQGTRAHARLVIKHIKAFKARYAKQLKAKSITVTE